MKKILMATMALSGVLTLTTWANCASITYELSTEFSHETNTANPEGTPPWVILTFDDGGTAGSVDLTITTAGLVEREILSDLYFNFDTNNFDIGELHIDPELTNAAVANSISVGSNSFKADGAGYFDININFPPPRVDGNDESYFNALETVVYKITSTQLITANSFSALSTSSDKGMFGAAAHIQRIGEDDYSAWVAPVPEPTVTMLFSLGVLGYAGIARRKITRK